MGQLYDFGFGVGQSDVDALAWYRRAAEHGSAAGSAQRWATSIARDAGSRPMRLEAARWYRHAADGDDIRAQYQLGDSYLTGTGVTRDYVSAYVWFSLAAGQAPLEDNRKQLARAAQHCRGARMTPEDVAEAAPTHRGLETAALRTK